MNNIKYPNLRPWQQGQSGNPAGRKLGSKNISTIVRELLEQDVSPDILARNNIAESAQGEPTSYAKAVVQVAIYKALKGDMRAIVWLTEQQERNIVRQDVERLEPIVVSQIEPRNKSTVD